MIRAFGFLLMLSVLASAGAAHAQTTGSLGPADRTVSERPILRDSVTVNGAIVRIGDVVERAGAAADIAIFRAPDPGTTGTVAAAAILDALRAHNVIAVDTANITEVTVTRISNAVSTDELKARIAAALAQRSGLGEAKDLTIRFDGEIAPLEIDPARRDDLRLLRATYNPQNARFEALFVYTPPNAPGQRLRYTGTAQELVDVTVLVRSVERGTVLRAEDISLEQRPRNEVTADLIGAIPAAGKAIKRAMRAGQILREADLSRPEIVHRGESVVIVYRTDGIFLTTRGKAEEGGAMGDVINVVNLQSKRTLQGVVTGPGEVTMSPARRISSVSTSSLSHHTRQATLATAPNVE